LINKVALLAYNAIADPAIRVLDTQQKRLQEGTDKHLCPPYNTSKKSLPKIAQQFELTVNALKLSPPRPSKKEIDAILAEYAVTSTPKARKPASPPQSASTFSRRTALIATAIASALVLAAATFIILWRPSDSSNALPNSSPSSSTPNPTLSASPNPPGSPTLPLYPGALDVNVGRDVSSNLSLAFPKGMEKEAVPFLKTGQAPPNFATVIDQAYDVGAYAAGGITLSVTLHNNLDQPINVRHIQTVKTPGPAVDGSMLFFGNQGQPTNRMHITLDAADPVPKAVIDHKDARPFFDKETVKLTDPSDDQTLVILLTAARGSYSFVLYLEFTIAGKRYTQRVDRHGKPFQVAANMCKYDKVVVLNGLWQLEERAGDYFKSDCTPGNG
jgi:hypothetical protein